MRRSFLAVACASAALLAACGSSTTESAFTPTRLVAFGDATADVGQQGALYTVNNGSINNWTLQIASFYGLDLKPVSAGGLGYAQGNARVLATPDAAGGSAPTLAQQIDSFAASQQFGDGDLVMLSIGVSDIVAGMMAVRAGTQSEDQFVAAATQAGKDLAAQVHRLTQAGARHILLTGTYDLSRTPWGKEIQQESLLSRASTSFNNALLVNITDLADNVLYVDAAYYINVFEGSSGGYGFDHNDTPVCTSVDAGAGIGIGAGEVNSLLCNANTLVADADADRYLFADKVYITPNAQRQLGNYAYDRLRVRW
jgi:phospholipase/lecithinase/hemolysin